MKASSGRRFACLVIVLTLLIASGYTFSFSGSSTESVSSEGSGMEFTTASSFTRVDDNGTGPSDNGTPPFLPVGVNAVALGSNVIKIDPVHKKTVIPTSLDVRVFFEMANDYDNNVEVYILMVPAGHYRTARDGSITKGPESVRDIVKAREYYSPSVSIGNYHTSFNNLKLGHEYYFNTTAKVNTSGSWCMYILFLYNGGNGHMTFYIDPFITVYPRPGDYMFGLGLLVTVLLLPSIVAVVSLVISRKMRLYS